MPRLPRINQKYLEAAGLEQLEQRDPINARRKPRSFTRARLMDGKCTRIREHR